MRTITERAPAKLNLTLDILRKRPDGYHDLQMVMQTVSLYDTVTVQEREGGLCLVSTSFQLPEGKTMEQRAAEAFFAALGRPVPGLEIRLEKQIPAYAGMGGGSADVAALLRALRTLYAPDLTDDVLERIGLTVGSDVPFCIRGGTMLAEGRGEKLTPLPALPPCCILICKPDFDLPTPLLFGRVRLETLGERPDLASMEQALARGSAEAAARQMRNVFEQVLTEEERREICDIKDTMRRYGAWNAVMTGSGPTVFGLFEQEEQADRAAQALAGRYGKIFHAVPVGQV